MATLQSILGRNFELLSAKAAPVLQTETSYTVCKAK